MTMEKIIGLIDAPFTPMKPNGDINLEPIPAYAAMLAKNGLKGVFINGSSGEGYMLTTDERKQLAEAWMAAVPAGFKVIVHVLPFYFYHIPAFNGCFLPMLDFLKAVDGRIPNFAGIKYTFESLYEYNQCRLYKDGKFDMLHGQDETYLPSLAQGGAQGGICGTTNYNGREQVAIGEAWAAGDLEKARELQSTRLKLVQQGEQVKMNAELAKIGELTDILGVIKDMTLEIDEDPTKLSVEDLTSDDPDAKKKKKVRAFLAD